MPTDGVHRGTPGDETSLTPLVAAALAAGDFSGSSDPPGHFFLRSLELEPQLVAVAWENGQPVGFISPEFKVLVVSASSRRRGNGRRLVEAGLAIERERHRANLLLGPPIRSKEALAFLRATGFEYHSTLWELALPPDRLVPSPSWPEALLARSFDRSRDVGRWVELFNEAFAGHPTPLQLDEGAVIQFNDDPEVDDADMLVLEDPAEGGALVGFCSTDPRRSRGAIGTDGEIWTIGVRPDRQGRGLGRQLVRWGVCRLQNLGVGRVSLSVNGRNEHALRLYEGEGFARSSTRERWARPTDS
ncbi:MAG TPA: N-acetyltransferase [Candidatus Limnocylindrales bacterium]